MTDCKGQQDNKIMIMIESYFTCPSKITNRSQVYESVRGKSGGIINTVKVKKPSSPLSSCFS